MRLPLILLSLLTTLCASAQTTPDLAMLCLQGHIHTVTFHYSQGGSTWQSIYEFTPDGTLCAIDTMPIHTYRDPDGRISRLIIHEPQAQMPVTISINYDPQGRISSTSTLTDAEAWAETYSYDPYGRIQSRTYTIIGGGATEEADETYTYTYPAITIPNRPLAWNHCLQTAQTAPTVTQCTRTIEYW